MNDTERTIEATSYHMIFAIRRKKENRELKEMVFRQIVRDMETDLAILKARMSLHPGVWRIYHTVNKRLHKPAMKMLMKRLIDFPEDSYRIDTLFKTMMLKPECKASRHFLIDVDTKEKEKVDLLNSVLEVNKVTILHRAETPNGFHIVTEKFDTRLIAGVTEISYQTDAYYLLDVVTIGGNEK